MAQPKRTTTLLIPTSSKANEKERDTSKAASARSRKSSAASTTVKKEVMSSPETLSTEVILSSANPKRNFRTITNLLLLISMKRIRKVVLNAKTHLPTTVLNSMATEKSCPNRQILLSTVTVREKTKMMNLSTTSVAMKE